MNSKIRALLVEDSRTQAREIAHHLELAGYEVLVADDGIQALSLVDRFQPHIIVLDVNLPGLNGFQVCHRIKRDPQLSNILIVMLTSADAPDDTQRGLELGADDYIPKDDFAIENLLSTLFAFQASIMIRGLQ